MFYSILVGLLLSLLTIGVHALGTASWIRHLQAIAKSGLNKNLSSMWLQLKLLCLTAGVLLLLHIVEVTIWAIAYRLLISNQPQTLGDFEDALYFSTVSFTALGFGDVVIEGSWRLLSGIQAMTGLLVFGWSTALLFAVVQRIWSFDEQRASVGPEESVDQRLDS